MSLALKCAQLQMHVIKCLFPCSSLKPQKSTLHTNFQELNIELMRSML